MLHWFNFKGIYSLDKNIIIKQKNTYDGAIRDIEYKSVPGRSGSLIIDNGTYKNINIKYDFTILNKELNLSETSRDIKNWLLSESGYFKLADSYDHSYFRMASCAANGIKINEELPRIGDSSIDFNCKPFRYSYLGQNNITITESTKIYNPEVYNSLPYIKITGSGNITLSINNKSYVFENIEEYIELDSELMIAYKGIEPQNKKMTSIYFPTLEPGENNISWVGNAASLDIIPRWCTL